MISLTYIWSMILTHSLGITWLVASNADSQPPPQIYWISIYSLTRCSGDTNRHSSFLSTTVQMSPKWFLGQSNFSNKWPYYLTNQPVLSLGNLNISKFSPIELRNNFLNIAFTGFGLTTCPLILQPSEPNYCLFFMNIIQTWECVTLFPPLS